MFYLKLPSNQSHSTVQWLFFSNLSKKTWILNNETQWNILFLYFRDSKTYTGNFGIDESILREEGMTDFSQYAAVPGTTEFMPDFFLDDFDEYYEGKRKVVDR